MLMQQRRHAVRFPGDRRRRSLLFLTAPIGVAGLLLSSFLLLSSPSPIAAQIPQPDDPSPQILALNSYHVGYFWSDAVVQGIRSAFSEMPLAQLHFEFMDTRRHSDRQHLERLFDHYRHKFRNLKFDVIIASDDAALEFLMQRHEELFPQIPVVFCGIYDLRIYDFSHRPLFTGLVEVTDEEQNVALALSLHPKAQRIVVITDQEATLTAARESRTATQKAFPQMEFIYLNPEDMMLGELVERLSRIPPDSIGLLGAVFRDRSFQALTAEMSTRRITENSSFPFYGVNTNTLGYGIVGGCLNDGFFQGFEAAKRALAILKGTRPADLPILREGMNRYQFDFVQLKRWNIDQSLLPKGSVIINVPPSFYQQYRAVIWTVFGFLALQTVAIAALLINRNQRRKVEALLRQSEASLEEAQSIAHVGSWQLDLIDHELQWSAETYRIFGYPQERVRVSQEVFFQHVHPEDREAVKTASLEAQVSGKSYGLEHRIIRPDGSERLVREQAQVTLDRHGRPTRMVGTVQDITSFRHLEEQLRHSQKLEAIGKLAGGIAHDFNNLLTAINGYSELVLDRLRADDPIRSDVEDIRKAGERAATLTQHLLAFSRKQVLQPSVINLNAVVAGMERMLLRVLGEHIQLRNRLDPKLRAVKADPGQMEQVIVNLAVNARDAMPGGGQLTIETSNCAVDEVFAQAHPPILPGEHAHLSVTDTGCGMDVTTRNHIFEPFYTTKKVGLGTGLGLSVVYGIVNQSGGCIWVESEHDQGSSFHIYLPICHDPVTEISSPQSGEKKKGTETVLVVEDEPAVRDFICHVLRRNGYEVFEAANGRRALELSGRYASEIQLMITDVVMPEMGGKELAETVALTRPRMKVLFVSGYTESRAMRESVLDGSVDFLQKPLGAGILLEKVRQVLDTPAPRPEL